MPIYEFRCKKCGAQREVFMKMSDKPPAKCAKCGGRLEKLFSSPAIQFKGEGWYVTDYARKGSGAEKAEKADKELAASDSSSSSDKPAAPTDKDKTKKSSKKADKS